MKTETTDENFMKVCFVCSKRENLLFRVKMDFKTLPLVTVPELFFGNLPSIFSTTFSLLEIEVSDQPYVQRMMITFII